MGEHDCGQISTNILILNQLYEVRGDWRVCVWEGWVWREGVRV